MKSPSEKTIRNATKAAKRDVAWLSETSGLGLTKAEQKNIARMWIEREVKQIEGPPHTGRDG